MVDINQIKKLREETEVSITECKKALEKTDGDFKEAKEIRSQIIEGKMKKYKE